jgi:hypothetical protein
VINKIKINIEKMLITGVIIAPTLLWLNESFPARMSSDSLWPTWDQVLNGRYTTDHPVIYTIFVKITSFNGNFLPGTTIFQSTLLTIALFVLINSILNNYRQSSIIASLVMITPFGGAFASTIWKDVPFAFMFIFGITYCGYWVRTKENKYLILSLLSFSLAAMFRHNGMLVLLVMIMFISIFLVLGYRKIFVKLILVFTFCIFMSTISTNIVNKIFNAKGNFTSWATVYPFMTDLAYAASTRPDLVNEKTTKLVSLYSTLDSFEGAKNCSSGGYMVTGNGFNPQGIINKKNDLVYAWLSLLKKHPEVIMAARMCRTQAFLPPPFSPGPIHPQWNANGIYQPNEFGLVNKPPIQELASVMRVWQSFWLHNTNEIAWPGRHLLMGILLAVIILSLHNNSKEIFIQIALQQLLSISLIFSLILIAPSPDFRYAAITQLITVAYFFITSGLIIQKIRKNLVNSI